MLVVMCAGEKNLEMQGQVSARARPTRHKLRSKEWYRREREDVKPSICQSETVRLLRGRRVNVEHGRPGVCQSETTRHESWSWG